MRHAAVERRAARRAVGLRDARRAVAVVARALRAVVTDRAAERDARAGLAQLGDATIVVVATLPAGHHACARAALAAAIAAVAVAAADRATRATARALLALVPEAAVGVVRASGSGVA